MPTASRRARSARLATGALALVVALLAAACSGDDGTTKTGADTAPGADPTGTVVPILGDGEPCRELEELPAVEGKPTVTLPEQGVTEMQVTDLVVGDGAEAGPGDIVTAHYVGISCGTGKQFDSSWDKGAPGTFPLTNQVIRGWGEGLPGMRVGGRRMLVLPPNMGYGRIPPRIDGIAANDTLVFVVDLLAVEPNPDSLAGRPCVEATGIPPAEGKPDVPVPVGPPPTDVVVEDLVEGTGDPAGRDDRIEIHLVMVACSTGQQIDSTWDRGEAEFITVRSAMSGLSEGLEGMRVGGRRLIVVPPDRGFGAYPPAGMGVGINETLVYVVDAVSIEPAG